MKTAIDNFLDDLISLDLIEYPSNMIILIFEKAKNIEKQQIIDAYFLGSLQNENPEKLEKAEKYYFETYEI